ncbi:E3 ubiquitin-protein ligase HERC2 [Thraustotheca clavata]|uniref:E3 ubiquitin-protein ligase HERC2 n=1 Tax=Thraustotheca clavata TaxID=74557 RepID=A0A1W0A5Y9_9STRA|nr:E3 ubiquitin-protein ligase HERC2 [Thraustotheca clavata]
MYRRIAARFVPLGVLATSSVAFMKAAPSNDAQAYSWGSNAFGQLGHGHENDISTPRAIKLAKASGVASGGNSSAILTADGKVYTFGAGGNARLGHGDDIDTPNQSTPQLLQLVGDVAKVEIGEYHMAALTNDHSLWTWGRNGCPQLGHDNAKRGYPNEIKELHGKVQDIACGRQQTVAVTTDGQLYVWGYGHEGALGLGNRDNVNRPKLLKIPSQTFTSVTCGREYTLALTKDHKVFSWGANDYGQLGVAGTMRYQRSPVHVTSLDDVQVTQVAAGDYHSAALTASGEVYTWGNGRDGQLGLGTSDDRNIPRKVTELDGIRIVHIACGGGHTACVAEDGSLWVFGRGRSGQLGRGDHLESIAAARKSPTQVHLPQKVSSVSCGSDHTMAL